MSTPERPDLEAMPRNLVAIYALAVEAERDALRDAIEKHKRTHVVCDAYLHDLELWAALGETK